jgi:hypothetical protein
MAAAAAKAHSGRQRASSIDSRHASRVPVGSDSHDERFRNGGPDHPQTFAYGQVIWHQLYLDTAGELAARITFSKNRVNRVTFAH